jgi:hypothetical protein
MADASLTAVFGGNTVPLEQACKRAASSVTDFTSRAAKNGFGDLLAPIAKVAAAVGSVGAVMSGIKGALDLGGEMVDLANRTGLAVQSAYGLRQAFKDAGVDANALGPKVNKMQKSLASAVSGGKEGDALKALGLDPQALASMDPGKAFAQIGNAIAQLPNATERAAASMSVFGKSGAELLQVFMDPSFKDAGNISNTAKLLGENAGIFDKASDALGHVGEKTQGFFVGVASGMTGLLDTLANGIHGVDLSSIGKQIGDAINIFITAFNSGNITTIISSAFMIGIKEAVNFLSAGFMALFQTLPDYVSAIGKQFVAYFELLTNPEFWSGLKDSFLSVAAAFRGTMLMGVANILDALRDVPGIGGKIGRAADAVRGMSDSQFQQSAAYSESAANEGMGAAINKLAETSKSNISNLVGKFMENFRGNGQIMGGTDAEKKALAAAIADTLAKSDAANATATANSSNRNKEATDANANRIIPQGAFAPEAIGMGAKSSIIADSLAKVGGGGVSVGGGNPLLEENRKQTSVLNQINQNIARAITTSPAAAKFAY